MDKERSDGDGRSGCVGDLRRSWLMDGLKQSADHSEGEELCEEDAPHASPGGGGKRRLMTVLRHV
ncbi:MAG: hypothetical protein ABFD96_01225, partial [Armatimonadia bacterium]